MLAASREPGSLGGTAPAALWARDVAAAAAARQGVDAGRAAGAHSDL